MLLFDHVFIHIKIYLLHFAILITFTRFLNFNKGFHCIILLLYSCIYYTNQGDK